MMKNSDIRGFFATKSGQSSSQQVPSSSQPTPSKASSIGIPSSPVTPVRHPPKTPLTRDDVIKGSDDEDSDSDSDCSLESLTDILGAKAREENRTFTPKAKKVAPAFPTSPLTLQQHKLQKHQFNLKSLLKHARQDDATDESARRAENALRLQSIRPKAVDENEELDMQMQDVTKELLNDDEEHTKGDKLAMAVKRTDQDDLPPRCYFFGPGAPLRRNTPRRPFPKKAAADKWKLLSTTGVSREQMFIRGLPTAFASKGHELPDELYQWILDEICIEENLQLRMQYCNLAALCPDDTRRLFTDDRLRSMLEKTGAAKECLNDGRFELTPGMQDPYPGRNWSFLESLLLLLGDMASNMDPAVILRAVQLLLRMSLDPIVSNNIRVRSSFSKAIDALISALPEKRWAASCEKLCLYLYNGVQLGSQRYIAINILPNSSPRFYELRRRLSTMALFQSVVMGAKHPDEAVTFHDIFKRLELPDFQVTHTTDFTELNALIGLLGVVLNDGSYLRVQMATASPKSDLDSSDPEFDAQIDALLYKLKVVHDKINDNTLLSRKEAKAAIDCLSKRLTYTVRTRPPAKTNIFDGMGQEDTSLPKQRDFMRKWAQRKAEIKAEEVIKGRTPPASNQ